MHGIARTFVSTLVQKKFPEIISILQKEFIYFYFSFLCLLFDVLFIGTSFVLLQSSLILLFTIICSIICLASDFFVLLSLNRLCQFSLNACINVCTILSILSILLSSSITFYIFIEFIFLYLIGENYANFGFP